jgi:hypothetical protein
MYILIFVFALPFKEKQREGESILKQKLEKQGEIEGHGM